MIKDLNYRISPAKDGNPTLIVQSGGKEIFLHSKMNPMKESELSVFLPDPEKFDLLIILGCGLGYSFLKLKEDAGKFRRIIIIDILYGIENEIAKNQVTSFFVERKNIRFFSGMEINDIEKELTQIIDFEEIKGMQVIEHLQSGRIFPAYYDEVRSSIKAIIDRKAGDKATIKVFGNLFLRNALNNLNSINNCLPVSAFEGKFRGRKAVIVSSAPSLEDNIELLKSHSDDLYIIAVDSALPVLRCFGIKPDIVISIDPQGRIGEHFLGHEFMDILHIFSIVSPPVLVEKYRGYISLNSHPVSQIIDDMYPGATGSIDSSTGSVAGDAFMFAIMAGFEYIVMTGFDFSFSQNIIYARETAYQKRYSQYFNNRFKTAETFNGAYIFKSSGSLLVDGKYTRRSFIGYRNSLNSLIRDKNFNNIFMINRRGLPLSNVQVTDFDSFMKLESAVKENKQNYLNEVRNSKVQKTINIKRIRERLSDEKILGEFIRESLGAEADPEIKGKVISLIKGTSPGARGH